VHLVCLIVEMYHDSRPYERQICPTYEFFQIIVSNITLRFNVPLSFTNDKGTVKHKVQHSTH